MANKVLSIKMDEKDIERIKKYYETLDKSGYLSSKTVSLNAFYKHLLLDYLEADLCEAFATYEEYDMTPKCINPDDIELINTYNLSSDTFESYTKCIKEMLSADLREMNENAACFSKLLETNVFTKKGFVHELNCESWKNSSDRKNSFWGNRVMDKLELLKEHECKVNEIDDIDEAIVIVEKSSVSEESKKQVINELLEHKKKLQQNRNIIQNGRLIK